MHGSRHGQGAQIARFLMIQREGRTRKCPAFLRSGEGLRASISLARPLSGIRPLLGMAIFLTDMQDIYGGIVNHG